MNIYLKRYAWKKEYLKNIPDRDTNIILVIPAYNEPEILPTLESLSAAALPPGNVEVLVVINKGVNECNGVEKRNLKLMEEIKNYVRHSNTGLSIQLINEPSLPEKYAGVGLARKIGMDEAVRRFSRIDKNGIIVNLDADCTVEPNYLESIYRYFDKSPQPDGCSIYFEHPTDGPLDREIYKGIVNYELHIRYYIQGLRLAGFPFSYHTLGSTMAVRSYAYQKQGGMNKRKAAEDFHFLHKIIQTAAYSDLLTTTVYPSPRPSDRVPFGTGKAINDWLTSNQQGLLSYNPQSFMDLRLLIGKIPEFSGLDKTGIYKVLDALPESISAFLTSQNLLRVLEETNKHTADRRSFVKRFYRWFNGLKVLQYFHFSRDNFHSHIPIAEGAAWLLETRWNYVKVPANLLQLLKELRKVERKDIYRMSNNEFTPR